MKDEEILKENIKKFLESAKTIYDKSDFTSSAILYFKALFGVLDLIILRKTGKIPKDHSERFRILEQDFFSFYQMLDKLYPTYRETYSSIISKSECDEVRKNVERIIKEQKIL